MDGWRKRGRERADAAVGQVMGLRERVKKLEMERDVFVEKHAGALAREERLQAAVGRSAGEREEATRREEALALQLSAVKVSMAQLSQTCAAKDAQLAQTERDFELLQQSIDEQVGVSVASGAWRLASGAWRLAPGVWCMCTIRHVFVFVSASVRSSG